MTEEQAPDDVETLRKITAHDQRSQSEKDRDLAIAKCAIHTANHWQFLTGRGLPADLVARLTETFQESYLNQLFAPAYSFLMAMEDEE